jgi:hypothetical protein
MLRSNKRSPEHDASVTTPTTTRLNQPRKSCIADRRDAAESLKAALFAPLQNRSAQVKLRASAMHLNCILAEVELTSVRAFRSRVP